MTTVSYRVPILLAVLLCDATACKSSTTPSAPATGEAPTVRGVSTGMTLAAASKILGPGGQQPASAKGDLPAMTRTVAVADALLFVEVGRIKKIHAFRLDRGGQSIVAGASEDEVEALLGKPDHQFVRAGEPFWQYKFGPRRVEPVFSGNKLARVELTQEPARLGTGAPPYGKGSRGDMRSEVRLAVDGIELGMGTQSLDVLLFEGTPLAPGVKRFNEHTFAGFGDDGAVRWVLGASVRKDGRLWVRAGMPAKQVQEALATVGQLRTHGPSAAAYTFRQFGDLRMRLEPDGTVGAFELVSPTP